MHNIELINYVISILFAACYAYQICYILVSFFKGFFAKKGGVTKSEITYKHKFAVLICARNEEIVIRNLIESIKRQKYPKNLIKVFVAADNCTDDTADVARRAGAVVYERFNREKIGKGYALNFLIENIRNCYEDNFDGYLVFDADNLVDPNYVSEMNKMLCRGVNVATCYRNTKNYGDNWISAGYALWFLRESKYLNEPRSLLRSSAAVSGTGFMFSKKILDRIGDWHFYTLTEDIEFTIDNVICNETIAYCPDAIIFDEQPTKFSQSWRQRMRWSRGYLQVFAKYGKRLIMGMLRGSFSCFDMSMTIMPAFILSVACQIFNVVGIVVGVCMGGEFMAAVRSLLQLIVNSYILTFTIGLITTVSEWNQIHTKTGKKILYIFTFPFFMFTYIPISLAALFSKVTWKPIEHKCATRIEEIQ